MFRSSAAALRGVVGPALAQALQAEPETLVGRLQAARAWRGADADRHVITLGDTHYPRRLLETADPPLLLYIQGAPARLNADSVAIVGSRQPSAQGALNAKSFGAELSRLGLVVVSGLALGIDAAAHEGALLGAAGTLAVLGTGLDRIYPRQNEDLARRIAAQGTLISEYAPGTPALPAHFPQRNRIIAGLSLGTLVVEAALRSGSLITARLALEAGREVFAIPGSIHAAQSKGCHVLIRQGAKLVETAADITDELSAQITHDGVPGPLAAAAQEAVNIESDTDPVLGAMGHDPVGLDALMARTGWSAAQLAAHLLELEFQGKVARLPGGWYQRCGWA